MIILSCQLLGIGKKQYFFFRPVGNMSTFPLFSHLLFFLFSPDLPPSPQLFEEPVADTQIDDAEMNQSDSQSVTWFPVFPVYNFGLKRTCSGLFDDNLLFLGLVLGSL